MAVALSSKPLARIGRIWADGNLLRGVAGDFKTPTQFRFYDGHEDQLTDPLIASAEGSANAPAFRGIAYAMFEDLQLADFGNRIPSLTFEIFERDTPVPVNDIAQYASGGLIDSNSAEDVTGYALEGGDSRAGLLPLQSAMPILLRADGGRLELHDIWQPAKGAKPIDAAMRLDKARYDPPEQYRLHQGNTPQSLTMRHYDPAREYQIGVQRSSRADTGRKTGQIDLAATLDSNAVRRLADIQLLQIQRSNRGWNGHAIINEDWLKAGDWITTGGDGNIWQITEIEHLGLVSRIAARQAITADPGNFAIAEPGRSVAEDDLVIGPTKLILMDLPALTAADPQKDQIAVAAAGNNKAWRSAALFINSGGNLNAIGVTAPAAIIGLSENSLPAYSSLLIDDRSKLLVKLLHNDMQLLAGSGSPLSIDAPYIWLSGEIIRYGLAEYIGEGRYRISRLLRGCHGSENKINGHQSGEHIVLLEPGTIRILSDVSLTAGQRLQLEAVGIGDDVPVVADLTAAALALKPLAPVHGRLIYAASGDITLSWIRRSRVDYGWQDGVEQPLTEDTEQYLVELWSGATVLYVFNTETNHLIIPANHAALSATSPVNALQFRIRQIGKFAQSDALVLIR